MAVCLNQILSNVTNDKHYSLKLQYMFFMYKHNVYKHTDYRACFGEKLSIC